MVSAIGLYKDMTHKDNLEGCIQINYGEKVIIQFDVYRERYDFWDNKKLDLLITSDYFHASETLHVLQKWTREYNTVNMKRISDRYFEITVEGKNNE